MSQIFQVHILIQEVNSNETLHQPGTRRFQYKQIGAWLKENVNVSCCNNEGLFTGQYMQQLVALFCAGD